MTATGARRIEAMGLGVAPPSGWEATIYRRSPAAGERTFPVLHAATIPIPAERGDYGGGVVELLGPADVFVGVLEFGPEAALSPLFKPAAAIPALTPDAFRPRQLQRVIRGQAGAQRFVAVQDRAFCLYAVIGSIANRVPLAGRANQLIGALSVHHL
jgi:hypothetical protein